MPQSGVAYGSECMEGKREGKRIVVHFFLFFFVLTWNLFLLILLTSHIIDNGTI